MFKTDCSNSCQIVCCFFSETARVFSVRGAANGRNAAASLLRNRKHGRIRVDSRHGRPSAERANRLMRMPAGTPSCSCRAWWGGMTEGEPERRCRAELPERLHFQTLRVERLQDAVFLSDRIAGLRDGRGMFMPGEADASPGVVSYGWFVILPWSAASSAQFWRRRARRRRRSMARIDECTRQEYR